MATGEGARGVVAEHGNGCADFPGMAKQWLDEFGVNPAEHLYFAFDVAAVRGFIARFHMHKHKAVVCRGSDSSFGFTCKVGTHCPIRTIYVDDVHAQLFR